jgi:hypothetical protein
MLEDGGDDHPKLSHVVRDCLDAADRGEKTLVFCARVESLRELRVSRLKECVDERNRLVAVANGAPGRHDADNGLRLRPRRDERTRAASTRELRRSLPQDADGARCTSRCASGTCPTVSGLT